MKKNLLTKFAPLAALAMLFVGCVTHQSAPPQQASDEPQPPPTQAEVVPPQPNMTFIWTPGFWDWQGTWVWVRGYWGPRPHPGAVWIKGGWVVKDGHRVWVHPHWR